MIYLMRFFASSLLLLSVASCIPVVPGVIPESYKSELLSADLNKDGFFSLSEINNCSSGAQVTAEQKKSGILMAKNNFTEAEFAESDKDNDNKLSMDELIKLLNEKDTVWSYSLSKCGEN